MAGNPAGTVLEAIGGKHFMAAWAVHRPRDGLICILFDFGCTFKGRIHLNFKELNFEVYV